MIPLSRSSTWSSAWSSTKEWSQSTNQPLEIPLYGWPSPINTDVEGPDPTHVQICAPGHYL